MRARGGIQLRPAVFLGLAICVSACAGPSPNPRPSAGTSASLRPTEIIVKSAMPVVALVGEEEVGVDEFLAECLHEDSAMVRQVLERVVLARLVRMETKRLGVVIGAQELAVARAAALAAVALDVEASTPGLALDEWISTRLGLDPLEFKRRIHERVERELLARRVVRAWLLGQDRAEVRILLATDLATAQAAVERHAGGEDFEELARELSVDRSAAQGGRMAPVIRAETFLGRAAFNTGVGDVAGPFEQQGRYLLVKVLGRHTGAPGLWREVREQVEASLEERGVEDAEFWQWKERMHGVHPVDISPMFRLAGEPDL
jgi:hypothetical protein